MSTHPQPSAVRRDDSKTLADLKKSVSESAREFHSKYRHHSKFAASNGRNAIRALPLYAKILICVALAVVVLFIAGFIYTWISERRRSKKTGKKVRWGEIFWGAVKTATFLWLPIYIFHAIKHRSIKGKPSSSGSYAEISEDQQRLNSGAVGGHGHSHGHARGPSMSETKPWSVRDAPADNDAKFEPMGYKSGIYDPYSAYAGAGEHTNTRVTITGAPSPEPATAGFHQPPPAQEAGDLGARSRDPSPARFPVQPPATH